MTFRAGSLLLAGLLLVLRFLTPFAASSSSDDADPPNDGKQPAVQLATLHATQVPLADVLRRLAAQTSESAADLMGDPDPKVNLDLQGVAFWEALDALAEKAGGRVDLHAPNGVALVNRPAGWKPPLVSHSGLFRTSLSAVSAKVDLETGTRTYTAALETAWEPHLLPILLETKPQNLVVRDDAGNLIPSTAGGSSLAPVDGRIALAFDVTLPPLSRSVRSLSLVEGRLYAVAPTKMLTFTFDSLENGQNQTQENVVCRVSKVITADDHWSIEITLDYPEGNVKLDSYQSWVVNNEIHLESKNGADRFPSSSYLLEESTPRHAVLTYNFSDKARMKRGLAEWKLVYRTPALVVKVPITFSFKDVPLP